MLLQEELLKALPAFLPLVESVQLQRAIGKVEGVIRRLHRFVFVGPPREVLEASQMSAVGVSGGIELFAHLKFRINSGIEEPLVLAAFEINETSAINHAC